jgi:hypothetical protein
VIIICNLTFGAIAALLDGRAVDWLDDEKDDARYRWCLRGMCEFETVIPWVVASSSRASCLL